ncbi:DUF6807 family protein [Microbispora sp. NPDC046973]|uniref:DUF6807 family protein n=1 Tax=Microbispora sp. NPDC046973 TaxID=3155022 RepID=UPI0033E994DD
MQPLRVVVAGVHGYGAVHLENVRRLQTAGLAEPVGVCDTRPPDPLAHPGLGDLEWSADLPGLIERTGAQIAVIATPIHTHAALATAALRAGAHVLLEKPPAPSVTEFERIADAVEETGLACQVGFQSLGSAAIPAARALMGSGLRGIGVAGAWERRRSYYTRAAWAGRRTLNGADVVDGAMTNPFAHGIATALAVAGADTADAIAGIDLELYRVNAIEADDTSSARLRLRDGTVVTVAVSLCADRENEPYLLLHGEQGTALLRYTTDEIEADGVRTGYPRTDLLENLLAHVRDGAELLVPLAATGAFTRFLDEVRRAPGPVAVPREFQRIEPERRVLPGISGLAAASAERLALLSELGFPGTARRPAAWPETTLRVAGREVAVYEYRGDLQATDAPRPYLHPVRTLGGAVVTETRPADHPHHFGVSVAVSDVDGVNFWGGSTYVPGRGHVTLPNHGRQRRLVLRAVEGGYAEELEWTGPGGRVLLRERRTLTARALDDAWALDVAITLTGGTTGNTVAIRSSACKGRAGAGYGGFFWRAPRHAPRLAVLTAHGDGEDTAHGSRDPWLALVSDAWSLVFVQTGVTDPWFVRVAEYPGVGPALAWSEPLSLAGDLSRAVTVVVADGRLSRERCAGLAERAR